MAPSRMYSRVFFHACFSTDFGETVRVVGDQAGLGRWDPTKGHQLTTSEDLFPCWFSIEPVLLPVKESISYKYVIINGKDEVVRWEEREDNRNIVPTGVEMTVEDDDGLYREQTQSHLESGFMPLDAEAPGNLSNGVMEPMSSANAEAARAKATVDYVHDQETENAEIDENDSVVIVAFELPVKVYRDAEGTLKLKESKSALLPTLHHQRHKTRLRVKTVGWCGMHVESEEEKQQVMDLLDAEDCYPVFSPKQAWDDFLAFSHRFLWPLFHNVVTLDIASQHPFNTQQWQAYQSVNQSFAGAVMAVAHETDLVWIHDYHLLTCPLFLTRKLRKANVGLFLHIPFPSSEVFRCLPVREEILRGMLCSDLIGFHFFEYARHFLVACKRLLGLEHHCRMGGFLGMEYNNRNVMIRIGHAHIQWDDSQRFVGSDDATQAAVRQLRQRFAGKFIFAAIDRCERLAGLLLKLRAFAQFLDTYPYAQGKVVLIQYAYPTISYWHEETPMRQQLKDLVEKINSSHFESEEGKGQEASSAFSAQHQHIFFEFKEVTKEEKYALFQCADCFFDTSIRDGLNLNPFEYICCRGDAPGTMVLSEFTGCSGVLTSASRVNPWRIEAVVEALDRAVTSSSSEESRDRFFRDKTYLSHGSTLKWAEDFLLDLRRSRKKDDLVYVSWGFGAGYRVLGMDNSFRPLDFEDVVACYRRSKCRVLFLDHEGTLAPDRRKIASIPSESLFSLGSPPSKEVRECLKQLAADPKNTVVILSGRDKAMLEEWFSDIENLGLAAEHGFYYMVPGLTGHQWCCMCASMDFTWKQIATELMKQYVKRTQGAFIENKGSALVFQYRDADPDFGQWQAKELSNYLSELLFGYPVAVVAGKGYVEVKLRGVNKGVAVNKIIQKVAKITGAVDFILVIGDDRSDEDMFTAVKAMIPEDDPKIADGTEPSQGHDSGLRQLKGPQHARSLHQRFYSAGTHAEIAGMARSISSDQGVTKPCAEPTEPQACKDVGSSSPAYRMRSSCALPVLPAGRHSFFTVTVGKKPSQARFYVNDPEEVSELLHALSHSTMAGRARAATTLPPPPRHALGVHSRQKFLGTKTLLPMSNDSFALIISIFVKPSASWTMAPARLRMLAPPFGCAQLSKN